MSTPIVARPCMGSLFRTQATTAALPRAAWAATFSTTASQCKRQEPAHRSKTRDNNRFRGVSPLRRSGLREPVSVSNEPLPRPAETTPKVKVDPNHGLYAFFEGPDKLIRTPAEDREHGRAWTVEELRRKDWDDLHKLWWVCCRERNKISTMSRERERLKMGFGAAEATNRDDEIKRTMKSIKHVLTERYYLWEDAFELAARDKEINLSGQGEVYSPTEDGEVFEDDIPTTSEAAPAKPAPAS